MVNCSLRAIISGQLCTPLPSVSTPRAPGPSNQPPTCEESESGFCSTWVIETLYLGQDVVSNIQNCPQILCHRPSRQWETEPPKHWPEERYQLERCVLEAKDGSLLKFSQNRHILYALADLAKDL